MKAGEGPDLREWCTGHRADFSGELHFDEPLARHTYYRIGGPARVLAIPRSVADLAWLAEALQITSTQFWILGLGSNVLVDDAGLPGLVIKIGRLNLEISALSPASPDVLRTGASVAISSLLRRAAQEGWGNLEFLAGVPGSVGGAIVMNAGTHLGESSGRVRKVETFDLRPADGQPSLRTYAGAELAFEYRRNRFLSPTSVVFASEWSIEPRPPGEVKRLIDETLARRKATQPVEYPSCGSVFKNPRAAGRSAWQVIDQLGLRGYREGGAQFAEKHSNFIINLGGASARDVAALIDLAKARARAELGIELEEEVKRWVSTSPPR